jgi:hypothetical protein
VHKNVRLTQLLLVREIQNANNLGCVTGTDLTVNNIAPLSNGYDVNIHEFKDTFEAFESDETRGQKPNTDSFKFTSVSDSYQVLTQDMSAPHSSLDVNDTSAFLRNDIVLITDCQIADIFVLSSPSSTQLVHNSYATEPGNGNDKTNPGCAGGHCLSKAYEEGARIQKIGQRFFYLSPDDVLMFNDGSGDYPWLAGIEDFQLEYGIDVNGDSAADIYVPAEDADFDLNNVRALKVYALFVSEKGGLVTDKTFDYAGKSITPDDGRYRYLLESFIELRNPIGSSQ